MYTISTHYPAVRANRPLPAVFAFVAIVTGVISFGCCRFPTAFVPVREAVHRSEISTTNRIELPLSETNRHFLLAFLKSGRNPALDSDLTIADPEAAARYAGLLELLSQPELSVSNLVTGEKFEPAPAFRPWFPDRAVRQVVDAHELWPPPRQPYALLDRWERTWWVFYHERQRLSHVMVTRALERHKTR